MDTPLIIERNNKYFNNLLFVPLIGFVVGAVPAYSNFASGTPIRTGIAILNLIFCIIMLVFIVEAIKKIIDKSFALEVNKEGVIDNISWAKAGLINWGNIERFETLKYYGYPHLFVFVKDADNYIQNVSGLNKGIANKLYKYKRRPISIDLRSIKYDADELLKILEREKAQSI